MSYPLSVHCTSGRRPPHVDDRSRSVLRESGLIVHSSRPPPPRYSRQYHTDFLQLFLMVLVLVLVLVLFCRCGRSCHGGGGRRCCCCCWRRIIRMRRMRTRRTRTGGEEEKEEQEEEYNSVLVNSGSCHHRSSMYGKLLRVHRNHARVAAWCHSQC